jgi:hypothetical protein
MEHLFVGKIKSVEEIADKNTDFYMASIRWNILARMKVVRRFPDT